jgi:hypothetical protein
MATSLKQKYPRPLMTIKYAMRIGLHNFMQFIGNESDDTTKTAQAISFTTPPASLIFRLQKVDWRSVSATR